MKYTRKILEIFPPGLKGIMMKVFSMKYEDEPPYNKIIDAIRTEILAHITLGPDCQPIPHQFEWIVKDRVIEDSNFSSCNSFLQK